MRIAIGVVAIASLMLAGPAVAQAPSDVPADHWARSAVAAVISTGVMSARDGKFSGNNKVSRRELAITLVKLAKSLEKGDWANKPPSAVKSGGGAGDETVSRYVLASVINKVARAVAAGLPKPAPKDIHNSIVLPKAQPASVAKTDTAYSALDYLGRHRMIPEGSVLLRSGAEPVTGKQVSEALSAMIAGLNDRSTDEPQNREDLGPPRGHKH